MSQERLDSITTYSLGGFAITLPNYLESLTGWLQFLTIVFGFVVISLKLYFDLRKYFFKKLDDKNDDDGMALD